MKTIHVILLTAFAAALAAGAPAFSMVEHSGDGASDDAVPLPPGGPLRTMPHGNYQCATPGDAGGEAIVVVEEENFRISTASRYTSAQGDGTYLMRGDNLVFTRGPKKDERFVRIGDNQLRKLDSEGERTRLLCTRLGSR